MSEEELVQVIDEVISQVKPEGVQQMGQVIGQVKSRVGNNADASVIARLVKEKLS